MIGTDFSTTHNSEYPASAIRPPPKLAPVGPQLRVLAERYRAFLKDERNQIRRRIC